MSIKIETSRSEVKLPKTPFLAQGNGTGLIYLILSDRDRMLTVNIKAGTVGPSVTEDFVRLYFTPLTYPITFANET